nr:DegV family EDD domain-containing protein [Eubacterium sp.]
MMLKKLYYKMFGQELGLQERVFRVILIVGSIACVVGNVESTVLIGEYNVPLLILMMAMIVSLVATFKYRQVNFAATLLGIFLLVIVFPEMFFCSGGIRGGATIWLSLGFVYVFLMFRGKQLAFFLVLTVVVDVWTYMSGYYRPEVITALNCEADVYFDSFFSLIAVGVISGLILKYQSRTFERERVLTSSQKNDLEQITKSKNAFFANMSHEIRTPINSIIGWNEMILREAPDGDIPEYAENVQNASEMLLNLVNDIMDLSQLEIKKMEIVSAEYNVKKVIQDLVNMIQIRVKEKNLEMKVEIDETMPSYLFGDEKRMKQIILNLLTNAVKYTDKGFVSLSVSAERVAGIAELKITVADSGIGIRKEDVESLYDVFRRVDARRNMTVEGSGLGLAIVKQLLDLMGGEISVDSIYTKGTVFTVTMSQPIIDDTPIGEVDFSTGGKKQSGRQYQQSFEAPEARILVVDDHMMNAWIISKLLSSTKVQVDLAYSGAECLERTQQKFYHVILMDHQMPGMDGIETLKELRKQENGLCRDSHVVLVTASSEGEARGVYRGNRFDGFIEKPVKGEKLEIELLRLLPEEIIEYRATSSESDDTSIQRLSGKKKKNIMISTDSVADLPEDLLEKYDIKVAHLYIKTDKGRYEDGLEIDSDSLALYLLDSNNSAVPDSISMEEYEQFFAEALMEADEIIHITVAEGVGVSYPTAVAAARGFDHVHLVDSEQISGGQGLLVLYAADLVMKGYEVSEILPRLEKMRKNIEFYFILPSLRTFHQNGRIGYGLMRVCEALELHLVMRVRSKRISIVGVRLGNINTSRRKFLRKTLRSKRKIHNRVVYFTYVGCNVKQLNAMRLELTKNISFQNVIMQKASGSIACNGGMGTVGVAYLRKVDEKSLLESED